jgi:hypothetical protein
MIQIEIKNNVKFPELKLQSDLIHIAERIFIPWMQDGIDRGIDLHGGAFPANEPATVKAKGHNRVLIGKERKLRESFYAVNSGKNAVVISLMYDRKDIGKYLQLEGIRSKTAGLKQYNFFGISDLMEANAMNYMRQRVGEALHAP